MEWHRLAMRRESLLVGLRCRQLIEEGVFVSDASRLIDIKELGCIGDSARQVMDGTSIYRAKKVAIGRVLNHALKLCFDERLEAFKCLFVNEIDAVDVRDCELGEGGVEIASGVIDVEEVVGARLQVGFL